jgi:hypothetical protein
MVERRVHGADRLRQFVGAKGLHQRLLTVAAAALVFALATATGGVLAQPVHAGGVAGAATRSVSHYLALEREVDEALAARNDIALSARVDPQFEYRTPASPDVRDRDGWVQRVAHSRARIRDLAVKEDGDLAIVSFLADAQGKTRFVVDVWRGDTLLSRNSALAPEAPRAPKRPSGRE